MISSCSRINSSSAKYYHTIQRSQPSLKTFEIAKANFGIRKLSETTGGQQNEKSTHVFSVLPTAPNQEKVSVIPTVGSEKSPMKNFRETFTMSPHLNMTIERINEFNPKGYHLLSIQNSAYFQFTFRLRNDPLILPKIYMALRSLTGPDDGDYDSYKGSFNFTFALEVSKNKHSSKYLYSLCHYRSYIDFNLWQFVPTTDPRDTKIKHQPNNELFSDKDISAFSDYFCNYLLRYIEEAQFTPQPFVKSSHSNCILFGFHNDEYFCNEYKDEKDYEKARVSLKKVLPSNDE